MVNKKTILSVGLNDKDTKTQLLTFDEVVKKSFTILKNFNINGGTITSGCGMWDGIEEKSAIITLYDIELENVKSAVDIMKKAFNQEAIAVEIQNEVNIMFI